MKNKYLKAFVLALGVVGWSTMANAQFTEGFEGGTTAPTGWTVNDNDGDGATWTFGTPLDGSAHSGNNVAQIHYSSTAHDDYLITKQFTVTAGSTDRLRFYARNRSSSLLEQFNTLISTSGTATTDFSAITGAANPSNPITPPTSWTEYVYDLSDYVGQTVYIAFQAISTNEFDLFIDDVTIEKIPTCPKPTGLTATNITFNSADLGWTENGSATEWQIEWGTTGFTQGTGTIVSNINTNPYTLGTLSPITSYDYYVRSVCGPGDSSIWVGPYTFTTPQIPVSVFPYMKDWEAGVSNWSINNGTETNQWIVGSAVSNGGTKSLYISNDGGTTNAYTTSGASSVVHAYRDFSFPSVAPQIDVSFDWEAMGESSYDRLRVYIAPTSFVPTPGTQITASGTAPTGIIQLGSTNYSGGSTFTTESFSLPYGYANTNARLIFEWRNDGTTGTQPPAAIDNIQVTIPSCIPPIDLSTNSVSETSAELAWADTTGASEWQVEWNTTGFIQGTGNIVSNLTDTFTSVTVTPNTTYDFYVRTVCGPGDTSAWAGPYTFTTPCSATNVPYTQDFESAVTPDIPSCTSKENAGSGNDWITSTTFNANFPSITLKYPYNLSNAGNAWFYTQGINLTAGTEYEINFDYGDQNYVEKLKVAVGTSSQYSAMTNVLGDITTLGDAAKYNQSYYFTPATSGVYYFGFNAHSDANMNQLYVDNIVVDVAPSCIPPIDLSTNSVSATSAELAWADNTGATEWEVEWGSTGFTQGTGTIIQNVTDTFTTLTLTPNSTYDFYVRTVCGPGDTSAWAGPYTFTTPCTPTNVPYTQDFESSATPAMPSCNSEENIGTGNDWETQNVSNSGFSSIVLTYSYDYSNPADTWFYTQGVNLTSGTQYQVTFDYGDYNYVEKLKVAVGLSPNSSSMTTVLGDITTLGDATKYTKNYYFTASSTGVYYFGFNAHSDANMNQLYVDNIVVDVAPSCIPVADITVDSTNTDLIKVYWTPNGTESAWNVEWGAPGFTPGTGTEIGSQSNVTDTFLLINNLDPSAQYDIYVQSNCGSGDLSAWVKVSGWTDCAPITSLPWNENFDNMSTLGYGILPHCWTNENSEFYTNANPFFFGAVKSAPNALFIDGYTDDYSWTPTFALTAGTQYQFSFWYYGDSYSGWDGTVSFSGTQSSLDATVLDTFVVNSTVTTEEWHQVSVCFTPDSTDNYSFGLHVMSNLNPILLSFDDFQVKEVQSAGTSGQIDVCQTGGLVDLNSVVTIGDPTGTWMYSQNPSALEQDSLIDPSVIPGGDTKVYYKLTGCFVDSISALLHVYPPSSAGGNGTLTVCKNEPVNLLEGLTGSVDMGGTWYDPTHTAINGSQPNAGSIPGSFNYFYVVSNAACPADTAMVNVIVDGTCDWTGIQTEAFNKLSVYPNPTEGQLNIENPTNENNLTIVVLDMNGRVVLRDNTSLNNATKATISLRQLEKGIYTLKLFNDKGQKVFKIVKQ